MAAANVKDIKTDSFDNRKCSLCKETLKTPRLLPCQHSFCTSCLKTHVQGKATNFPCPTCDLEVSLPSEGVESLPENFLHQLLAETGSYQKRNCVFCKAQGKITTADLQCLDCEDAVCNKCQDFHKTPGSRNHRLVSVKELESGEYKQLRRKEDYLICKKHSEGTRQLPLKFYCKDCKTLECEECILHDEKFCRKETWKTFYEEKLESLKKEVDKLLKSLKQQKDIVGAIQKVEERMNENRAAIENQICDKATEIQELVEKVKNEKLTLVKEHFEKELQKCKRMLEKEGNQLKRFESTVTFVQDFMSHSTENEYLMYEEDVKTRMADFMIEREKFEMTSLELILKGSPTENLEQSFNDVIGQFKKRETTTDITGDLKLILVIKGKIKLNMKAHGITVAENGDVIAVGGSKIEILNKDGESKKVIECEELKNDCCVALKNDRIFITDNERYSKQLLVLNLDGCLMTAIRMPKGEQRQFTDCKVSATVDGRGTIYICPEYSSSIYTCTLDNTEPKLFTSKVHRLNLHRPNNLSMTPQGYLVVSNYATNYIQVYNDQAELLWEFRNLDTPFGVCCDIEGHIFIGSYYNNKIRVVKDGVLKGMIEIPDVQYIRGLVINKDGDLLVSHNTNEITKVSLWG